MSGVATSEPSSFRAGDTVTWRKTLSDYPAPAWTLAYKLLSTAGATAVSVAADGADHVATLTAAQSAVLAAGDYTLVGTVTKTTERYTVFQGLVKVLPDLAVATTHDGRSAARQALDALRAAYYAWTSAGGAGRKSMTLNNRSVTFESPGEMVERIRLLEQEVAREKALESAVNNGVAPGRIQVRM